MTIDVTLFAQWCVALTAIIVFLKWVSAPVKHVLDNNKKAMEALESAIVKISDDLKDNNFKWTESKNHRDRLQKVQDQHEIRIGIVEDRLISHDEQLKTLWKVKEEKKIMEELIQVITGSALSILTIFAGIVVKLIKDYLLKKGGEKAVKIAEIVARNAVEAVEQIAYDKDIKGIEKLTEAKIAVRDELSKHNVYLSDKQMEVFIEAAVKRMNDSWKGQ